MDDRLLQRISDLLDESNLSSWETDFLESVHDAVRAGRTLTAGQSDKLDEIEKRLA